MFYSTVKSHFWFDQAKFKTHMDEDKHAIATEVQKQVDKTVKTHVVITGELETMKALQDKVAQLQKTEQRNEAVEVLSSVICHLF